MGRDTADSQGGFGMRERLHKHWPLIEELAKQYQLDPNLVGAIVLAESGGDTFAVRFEPHVYRRQTYINLNAPKPRTCSKETERVLQSMSFGLMQVMGFNARPAGFCGWLNELCDPAVGLDQGCQHLAGLLKRWPDFEDAVSAYNQGSPRKQGGQYTNQAYVDKVMGYYHSLRRESA
jgi:soluble lytic murein transglycosylase-like protein